MLPKNTVMMLLNAEDTETLLPQGKRNTDASRAHMVFVRREKNMVLCLAGTYDWQIT